MLIDIVKKKHEMKKYASKNVRLRHTLLWRTPNRKLPQNVTNHIPLPYHKDCLTLVFTEWGKYDLKKIYDIIRQTENVYPRSTTVPCLTVTKRKTDMIIKLAGLYQQRN